MPIIIVIALLAILRYFEVGPLATMSWWWLVALMVIAFLWFEFFEPILGLDKKRAHAEMDRIREERVKKQFEDIHSRRQK